MRSGRWAPSTFTTACARALPELTRRTASSPRRRRQARRRPGLRRLGILAVALALFPAAGIAQTGPSLGNNGKPIEITADRLVVNQQQQVATFSGNVDAVQGDMSLRADELKVFYTDQAKGDQAKGDNAKSDKGKSDKSKSDQPKDQAGKGSGLSGNQNIKRIEAVGNVVIAAPDQTATGNRGIYDVANNSITLDGDVVLTRAENVVRGGHLVYDLTSGLVTITQPGPAEGQPARVRALFKPQQAQAKEP